jgi:hypothetical protein
VVYTHTRKLLLYVLYLAVYVQTNDWRGASDMYMKAGDSLRAANIVCEQKGEGWQHTLIEVRMRTYTVLIIAITYC